MHMNERVTHKEGQRFRSKLLWGFVIGFDVFMFVGFSWLFYYLKFTENGLSQPSSDLEIWTIFILFGLFIPALITSLFLMKLVVVVGEHALTIRMSPLVKRRIPYNKIVSCEICQFNPALDYGGWGVRYTFGGWAYIVSGNRGIKISLEQHKQVVISSDDPEKLLEALTEAINKAKNPQAPL
ncbi:hypothetical protein [Brevibacillus borstelensis]|uniref:hypothetical protein n=1 Tax=Brevibacillus borstelensis TaxID=45462 RepID=UPI0030C076ED